MSEFAEALVARHHFLQYALLAGLLASLACGTVGSLVVARRLTYLAGAIAHSVLWGAWVRPAICKSPRAGPGARRSWGRWSRGFWPPWWWAW